MCDKMSSSECVHVNIHDVAGYRTERTLVRYTDPPLRGSVHQCPLEFTKNEVELLRTPCSELICGSEW